MEDGEIPGNDFSASGDQFDPALEWPGHGEETSTTSMVLSSDSQRSYYGYQMLPSSNPQSLEMGSLRLLVRRSGVLPRSQRVAILDGFAEVQLGRDAAPLGHDKARIRLKEMEVSKIHCTVYWDQTRSGWAVVDMGSKHGTFLQSTSTTGRLATASDTILDPRGMRLSPSRISSIPSRLTHGDELSCGSTTFVVHIHSDGLPCADCSPRGGDEIALFSTPKPQTEFSTKRKEGPSSAQGPAQRDSKKAMISLKHNLLSQHSSGPNDSSDPSRNLYVDRSARRRALHADTPSSLPFLPRTSCPNDFATPSPPLVSSPPIPISHSNIGHRLLMKQGWQPGSNLGEPMQSSVANGADDRIALTEPIEVVGQRGRAGIGMPLTPLLPERSQHITSNWKDEAKLRRFKALKDDRSS